MQAVILAGGRGKRMKELTDTIPKPLLKVAGKSLLEHKIEDLPECIDEVIIVVGYLHEKIRDAIGDTYAGRKITYVLMKDLHGTGAAFALCKESIKGTCLVLMGDDLYGKDDMARAVEHDWYVGLQVADAPFEGGNMQVENGLLKEIVEGGGQAGEYTNTGMYMIGPEFFKYDLVQLPNGEYGLPQTIALVAADIPVSVGPVKTWIRITAPEDLAEAERALAFAQ